MSLFFWQKMLHRQSTVKKNITTLWDWNQQLAKTKKTWRREYLLL